MATKRRVERVVDKTSTEVIYFETSADVVIETAERKFLTSAEKAKLEAIIPGENTQVQSDWSVTDAGNKSFIKNKPNIPTNTSHLTNGAGYITQSTAINPNQIGAVNGVAGLGIDGKVPTSQLPSYVDDVLEYTNKAGFPVSAETGKIYIAKDTNITYRWSGTAYVEISASLALGETTSAAYSGDKGKANRDDINTLKTDMASVKSTKANLASPNFTGAPKSNGKDIAVTDGEYANMTVGNATKSGGFNASKSINLSGAVTGNINTNFVENSINLTTVLSNTGVSGGTYSVLTVGVDGRASAGGQILEFGIVGQTTPSAILAVGGLFFKQI